ncbi:holo-ACP synthase [Pelolinea submarina]|uniref:Holo-[acyl-carrier-protein] synthase n=1 Tax=Pelolinea submarina TaxID=913107 RepID=A0A347ZNF0_9CHLR|nr:holo-ACP synthase [Pelolinea submarina]REG08433.1 holo-[acyl-carrier-protein] synthase [Pelolinea submarina]BBB46831.1 holo-[acyl-carrier protein] synthase [Pelolinea submarina]
MKLITGLDLVEIARFRQLNPEILSRFYERVFTPAEIEYIGKRFEAAAGIFCAKEAIVKALGCGIGPVSWQEVEIHHTADGMPQADLHGSALQLANQMGMQQCSISISHTREYASAVAVALLEDEESSKTQ